MEFWDVNAMIGGFLDRKLAMETADELETSMRSVGIERALVFHSAAWKDDPCTGNDLLTELLQHRPSLSPAWVLRSSSLWEYGGAGELRSRMRAADVRAIRLFPASSNYELRKWNAAALLQFLQALSVPTIVNADEVRGGLSTMVEVCREYPGIPFIWASPRYRQYHQLAAVFEACNNFYVEISDFLLYCGVEDVVRRYGSRRLLFGTKMPFMPPGGAVARMAYADISEEEKYVIAVGNLARLMANVNLEV